MLKALLGSLPSRRSATAAAAVAIVSDIGAKLSFHDTSLSDAAQPSLSSVASTDVANGTNRQDMQDMSISPDDREKPATAQKAKIATVMPQQTRHVDGGELRFDLVHPHCGFLFIAQIIAAELKHGSCVRTIGLLHHIGRMLRPAVKLQRSVSEKIGTGSPIYSIVHCGVASSNVCIIIYTRLKPLAASIGHLVMQITFK